MLQVIDKLALIVVKEGRLLVARSMGKRVFYIPGGKRELEETDLQALTREVKEELSVELKKNTLKFVGIFEADADGKQAVVVKVTAYSADYEGTLEASNEIEEVRWVTYAEKDCCSEVTQKIMTYLYDKGLLLARNYLLSQYQAVLFDADKTLFSFDDRNGLEKLFSDFSLVLSDEQYAEYKTLNSTLWEQYHNHEITADIIKKNRFHAFSPLFGKTSEEINTLFLEVMLEVSEPLEGAQTLLDTLRRHGVKTGIITNGLTHIQARRVERAGFDRYIDALVVSEAVGKAKPHPDIFTHALTAL